MSTQTYRQACSIFEEVLTLPEQDRSAFVKGACSGQPALLGAVMDLLKAHGEKTSFLRQPAALEGESSKGVRHMGRYVVNEEIGHGAMSVVYSAFDPAISREVAVKAINISQLQDEAGVAYMRDSLLKAARSAGNLHHPHIVTIFDVGEDHGDVFVAMERVNGQDLGQRLQSGRLSVRVALRVLQQTADALDYAHQKGVLHRL